MSRVHVLDYGLNNLRSVERAVASLGYEPIVSADLARPERLILPGVGAFGAAMVRLAPFADRLRGLAADGVPILGICLGQQLLFDRSEEFGEHRGLGLVPGSVRFLPASPTAKVPRIGWSEVAFRPGSRLGGDVRPGDQVYFVHSLHCVPDEPADVAATSVHDAPFVAAVERGNVMGTQFHPEKSGRVGLGILRRFLACG